jgi:hypothetical protein
MYMRYSSGRPILHTDSLVITRKDYRDALDAQFGKPVLRKMVLGKLVEHEAKKAGVYPTDAEVTARLESLQSSNVPILQAAREDGVKMALLRIDTATDIALERLRMQGVKATDADAEALYRNNPELFVQPMEVSTTSVFCERKSDTKTAAEMLRQGIRPYVIARQPGLYVSGVNGFDLDTSRLTPAEVARFQSTMTSMKPGDISTLPIEGGFVVFRIQKMQRMEQIPFHAAQKKALELARLKKAPSSDEYLVRLYKQSHPVFEANQYAEYFAEYEKSKISATQTPSPVQTASAH